MVDGKCELDYNRFMSAKVHSKNKLLIDVNLKISFNYKTLRRKYRGKTS